jgi:hypothetical protein
VGSHQAGAAPWAPLPTSKSLIQGAGLPPQPACQKIGMSWMPAALALASSVSNSAKLNVPADGSIVPHGAAPGRWIKLDLRMAWSKQIAGLAELKDCEQRADRVR